MILTAVQERSLGCARDDDTGKGYPKRFESRDEWLVIKYYLQASPFIKKNGTQCRTYAAFPAWGRGTASAVDRVLS